MPDITIFVSARGAMLSIFANSAAGKVSVAALPTASVTVTVKSAAASTESTLPERETPAAAVTLTVQGIDLSLMFSRRL